MGSRQSRIDALLIEDNPGDAKLVTHHLNDSGVREFVGDVTVVHETTLTDGIDALDRREFDVLFLDLGLPESTGLETLDRVLSEAPRLPIIVLTGFDDRETSLKAIQRGAQEFLYKDDIDADLLVRTLRYAIERHEQEQTLRRQNERLEEFASIVSHDLRNPLSVLEGYLPLIRETGDPEHIDRCERAVDRMTRLIDDLLTLARADDALDTLEPVQLSSLVPDCWERVADERSTIDMTGDIRFVADRSRLQQLVENLLRNAVEHGGDPAHVRVGDLPDGFFVEDDGPGIPVDERDDVFEWGYSTEVDGTGYGLSIVETVADAHGWELTIADGDRGGARFEVTDVAAPSDTT